ncbi:hypothetical protein D9V28_09590 [Mycetocola zhadangensis]|uniref:Uncharacterized protein n=2 Tax=Mycetocola zhadangensis TaxID=1164595 RepID=A0A3L7J1U3_9MICO|nr:hypothetical protein D9V28_09590 [Mycetocola zhadangensis]
MGRRLLAVLASTALLLAGIGVSAPAAAETLPLSNVGHLDFLLDDVAPAASGEHDTWRLAEEPQLVLPWANADARDGGAFERRGGGQFDPATGYWAQGAFNADDTARAAVVYLRHWAQSGDEFSQRSAYELLRSTAYLQTATGSNAGNVVRWMQPDGTLNPGAAPAAPTDTSDSSESVWSARALWAFGEGYAAFRDVDPAFASFLQERLRLGVAALDRQPLTRYDEYLTADGAQVPAWLISNAADASAEAVLGLSAYLAAAAHDDRVRAATAKLAEGIAALGSGDARTWPYGAVLPSVESLSMWQAEGSQMPAALAAASAVLEDATLLEPAVTDSAVFDPILLTAGGADNGWKPTPVDRTQNAYGVDSRLRSLIAVSAAAGKPGLLDLASLFGSWYFGTNASGEPTYDPATGVVFDGVAPDGAVNRNSGAESTIHAQLSMLALDANPELRARALGLTTVVSREGATVVQAEAASSTSGKVVAPQETDTGESRYSGTGYLELAEGRTATFALPSSTGQRLISPVVLSGENGNASSLWRSEYVPLGVLEHSAGKQGITAAPGALLPQPLPIAAPPQSSSVSVTALAGPVRVDALIVRPLFSRLTFAGSNASTELVHSASAVAQRVPVNAAGGAGTLKSYNAQGALVAEHAISGVAQITVKPGGFAIVTKG